jgi:hypothetical protein
METVQPHEVVAVSIDLKKVLIHFRGCIEVSSCNWFSCALMEL